MDSNLDTKEKYPYHLNSYHLSFEYLSSYSYSFRVCGSTFLIHINIPIAEQKSYYFAHFYGNIVFFVMNTKYICRSIGKLLRHTLDVYIYHIYEMLYRIVRPPIIRSPGSTTVWADFAVAIAKWLVAMSSVYKV